MIKDDCESSLFRKMHSELALEATVTSWIQKFSLHMRQAAVNIWNLGRMLTEALILKVANVLLNNVSDKSNSYKVDLSLSFFCFLQVT